MAAARGTWVVRVRGVTLVGTAIAVPALLFRPLSTFAAPAVEEGHSSWPNRLQVAVVEEEEHVHRRSCHWCAVRAAVVLLTMCRVRLDSSSPAPRAKSRQ